MRVGLAGLWHETQTFGSTFTTLTDFEQLKGEAIVRRYAGTFTGVAGLIDGARAYGFELVPIFYAWATPSGIVTASVYTELMAQLQQEVCQVGSLDGLLAPLHGAMVADTEEDVEGSVLAALRDLLGSRPIIATLDLHANISETMVRAADVLIGYDTYPHVDAYERGMEACRIMSRLLEGRLRPSVALQKPPLLVVPQGMYTDRSPMRDLMELAHKLEAESDVVNITVAGGFPYADVERAGMAFVVTTHESDDRARECVSRLADMAWERRQEFLVEQTPVREAVDRAIRAQFGPVVLVDGADNIGGGAPGDGTAILSELLKQGAEGAVVVIADLQAVRECEAAGPGVMVNLHVGAKTDRFHGQPVHVRGRVLRLLDGVYRNRGPYMTGDLVDMGRTAVLRCEGIQLVLTEKKTPPFDAEQLRCVGIEAKDLRIIVVKSAIAWRSAFGDIAKEVIDVDAPGLCTIHLDRLPYRRIRRPIFPLDPFGGPVERRPV